MLRHPILSREHTLIKTVVSSIPTPLLLPGSPPRLAQDFFLDGPLTGTQDVASLGRESFPSPSLVFRRISVSRHDLFLSYPGQVPDRDEVRFLL